MANHETKTGDRSAPTQKLGQTVQNPRRYPGATHHVSKRSDDFAPGFSYP